MQNNFPARKQFIIQSLLEPQACAARLRLAQKRQCQKILDSPFGRSDQLTYTSAQAASDEGGRPSRGRP